MALSGALGRSAAAYHSLNEGITRASRALERHDTLKSQCAAVLGYDPTAPQALNAAAGGEHAVQAGSAAPLQAANHAGPYSCAATDGVPAVKQDAGAADAAFAELSTARPGLVAAARAPAAEAEQGQQGLPSQRGCAAPSVMPAVQHPRGAPGSHEDAPQAAQAPAAGPVRSTQRFAPLLTGTPVGAQPEGGQQEGSGGAPVSAAGVAGTAGAQHPAEALPSPRMGGSPSASGPLPEGSPCAAAAPLRGSAGQLRQATATTSQEKLAALRLLRRNAAGAGRGGAQPPSPSAASAAPQQGQPGLQQDRQGGQHEGQQQPQQRAGGGQVDSSRRQVQLAPPGKPGKHAERQSLQPAEPQGGPGAGDTSAAGGGSLPSGQPLTCGAASSGGGSEDDEPLEARWRRMQQHPQTQLQREPRQHREQQQPAHAAAVACDAAGGSGGWSGDGAEGSEERQQHAQGEQVARAVPALGAGGGHAVLGLGLGSAAAEAAVQAFQAAISAAAAAVAAKPATTAAAAAAARAAAVPPPAQPAAQVRAAPRGTAGRAVNGRGGSGMRQVPGMKAPSAATRLPSRSSSSSSSSSSDSSEDDEDLLPLAKRRRRLRQARAPGAQPAAAQPPQLPAERAPGQQQPLRPPAQQRGPGQAGAAARCAPPDVHGIKPPEQQQQQQRGQWQQEHGPEVVVILDDSSVSVHSGSSDGLVRREGRQQRDEVLSGRAVPALQVRPLAPGALRDGNQQQQQEKRSSQAGQSGAAGAARKWYAVVAGRRPGMYSTWPECAGQVLGFKGSEYKSFSSQQAARAYLEQRGVSPAAAQVAQQAQRAEGAAAQRSPPVQQQQQAAGPGSGGPSPGREGQANASRASALESESDEDLTSGSMEEEDGGSGSGGSSLAGSGSGGTAAGRGLAGASAGAAAGSRAGTSVGGFHFMEPEAARQFRRSFTARAGQQGGILGAKRKLGGGRPPPPAPPAKRQAGSPGEKATQQKAWDAFARAWREKNKPSRAEVLRAAKEQAAQTAAAVAARELRTPLSRLAAERSNPGKQPAAAGGAAADRPAARTRLGGARSDAGAPPRPAALPAEPEARRMHCRRACQRKVAGVANFVEILRAFKVPTHPTKLKDAYRLAVRMYHPDSNSKDKVWRTEEEKVEAEEVMKIINERKPDDL